MAILDRIIMELKEWKNTVISTSEIIKNDGYINQERNNLITYDVYEYLNFDDIHKNSVLKIVKFDKDKIIELINKSTDKERLIILVKKLYLLQENNKYILGNSKKWYSTRCYTYILNSEGILVENNFVDIEKVNKNNLYDVLFIKNIYSDCIFIINSIS